MSTQRIKMLLEGMKEEPNDPFYPYGLAIEYLETEPAKATEIVERLLQSHPEYLPNYHTAAKLFSMSHPERAIAILKEGIDLAKKLNEIKTEKELRNLVNELEF